MRILSLIISVLEVTNICLMFLTVRTMKWVMRKFLWKLEFDQRGTWSSRFRHRPFRWRVVRRKSKLFQRHEWTPLVGRLDQNSQGVIISNRTTWSSGLTLGGCRNGPKSYHVLLSCGCMNNFVPLLILASFLVTFSAKIRLKVSIQFMNHWKS